MMTCLLRLLCEDGCEASLKLLLPGIVLQVHLRVGTDTYTQCIPRDEGTRECIFFGYL